MIRQTEASLHLPFLYRSNRFIVFAENDGEELRTYVANPGKLQEILLPGVTTLLVEHKPHTKTKYETVGAFWRARWAGDKPRAVFLNTGRVNDIAEEYLAQGLVEGLEDARILRREYTVGKSRFDFLLQMPSGEMLLEVKSVTLVEQGVAMFPDAKSTRATKHVRELRELAQEGHRTGVLFVVQGDGEILLPDLHNDLDFARALYEAREDVEIYAVRVSPTLTPNEELVFPQKAVRLRTPWERLEAMLEDWGLYLVVLEVEEQATVEVGGLGEVEFEKGFYTYVGKGEKNLTKEMNRHRRTRKTRKEDIDSLRIVASSASMYAIRGASDAGGLVEDLRGVGERVVTGFGVPQGSGEAGRLIYTATDPVLMPEFQRVLTSWRTGVLKGGGRK